MKHFVKAATVFAIITGVAAGCGSPDDDKPVSSSTTSTAATATPKSKAPQPSAAPETSIPEPKSDGRMILLDRLSLPKMEGWKYIAPEEGRDDTNLQNDSIVDAKACEGKVQEEYQCTQITFTDEAASLRLAEEAGFKIPLKGMSRDAIAEVTLCKRDPFKKVTPRKPDGTDDIDGVTAYRYHATPQDCGVDTKSIPVIDPNFKGGSTLWLIKTDEMFISIYTVDSGAKGMVVYTDIDKLRYALNHAKWIG